MDVVYSLSGHYVANITSTAEGYPHLTFEFLIDIAGDSLCMTCMDSTYLHV